MIWYRAFYGSWAEPDGVKFLAGTYNFEDIKARAIKTAAEARKTVTISGERGSYRGVYTTYWTVDPAGNVSRK